MPIKQFKVVDFTNVCRFVCNRQFEEFFAMYKTLGFIAESYAKEKFDDARRDFIYWWCNLDPCTQEKIIDYVINFYRK